MNLGIGELVAIFGILVVRSFVATMLAGVGLAITRRRERRDNNPLRVLRLRYARGEISKEQYEQLKSDLA